MTKDQLRVISSIFRSYRGRVFVTGFSKFGGGKLLPWKRNRHPHIFFSFRVPHPRLEKWYCDSFNVAIGPRGGMRWHKPRRLVEIPYNYRPELDA